MGILIVVYVMFVALVASSDDGGLVAIATVVFLAAVAIGLFNVI